jgi:23S rRNA pseudouridine2605 synthase
MTQAPRSGSGRQPAAGNGARKAAKTSGKPAGAGAGKFAGKPAGKSAGKPAGKSTGKPASAGAGKPARKSARKSTANAGPRAFGSERFGRNLGPVTRNAGQNAGPKRQNGPANTRTGSSRSADEVDVHNPEGVRLQKVMASAGVASRRVCEDMIQAGRVEVDGTIVMELGVRVDPATAAIHVDGIRLQLNETMAYYVFNKPRGVVSTMEDPEGRPSIRDYLKNKHRGERLFHVGRLDAATEGLLLLTNDGELANRLTHPSYEVPKTYLVQVPGPMGPGVGAQMRAGIELEDGTASVDSFRLVDSTPGHILVEVVLHSGKNRIVRRLFEAVGHPVERLVRTQVGPIRINDQKQGTIRTLGHQEVGHLLASVGM